MTGHQIILRALEPSDIDLLYQWENDQLLWHLSNTVTPFSRFILEQYVVNSHQDIFTSKQLRLMIALKDKTTIGCIDLFDFDPANKRAGVGILINDQYRSKGYASEALDLLIKYAFETLELHQLFCSITSDNEASINLFQKYHFKIIGLKKDWIRVNNRWMDEYLLQLLNPSPVRHH